MTTKITTIYTDLVTALGTTLFPSKARLTNPYAIELNGMIYLKDGWGLAIGGAGLNTNRELCSRSLSRTITVTLSRELLALETDPIVKGASEVLLLEDQITFINHIEKNPNLGSSKMLYSADGGIQFVSSEAKAFIYIQTILDCEYLEAIT